MTAEQLREKYLKFFEGYGHRVISGRSLLPENDPTVLFTTAGMHPLVPFILGGTHPAGRRLVNYQRCIRTIDIDEVGDAHHLTFFEMLGNWSLGDYFKKESIAMSYEFLTSGDWLAIDPDRLYFTVFAGDANAPRDTESASFWQEQGVAAERVFFLPAADNWWGPAGETGPCGPDTEIFYDTLAQKCSSGCAPGCGCGKYIEIWNNVFMQYDKKADGSLVPLAHFCVDTGMGVERTSAILQGCRSVYHTELFRPMLEIQEKAIADNRNSDYRFGQDEKIDRFLRIICDHVRAAVFILGDAHGITPSNLGQGYILRRLIRRTIRHLRNLDIAPALINSLADTVIDLYANHNPDIVAKRAFITEQLRQEEDAFSRTLQKGEGEFKRLLTGLKKEGKKVIAGADAFKLYDTYGFPLELTRELAVENGMRLDEAAYRQAFEKHQQLSRDNREVSFKGGLADHSERTAALHTATHLLHQSLRNVLGSHVEQKGSNITADRLRFDFSHPEKMSDEQIKQVELLVNAQIERNLPISMELMELSQAKEAGALALFADKYQELVKVYRIGDFSVEVCGGPHSESTAELGKFVIKKEQSSSAGIRRIKAVLQK